MFNQLTWMGFRQEYVEYDKQPRARGRSGGRLARKIRLVVDSVTAFSNAPLRWCAYLGAACWSWRWLGSGGISLLPELGGGLLIVLAVFVGLSGLQLLALATVGEYVWSALAEARRGRSTHRSGQSRADGVDVAVEPARRGDSKIAISPTGHEPDPMIDCIAGYHLNPWTCGIAKFNAILAKELDVAGRRRRSPDLRNYQRPLLSIKMSEFTDDDAQALAVWVDANVGQFDLFLHAFDGTPIEQRLLAAAAHVYCGNRELSHHLLPSRPDIVELFCPGRS